MKELGEHVRRHADDYRDAVHEHFFATVAESRQIFALSMRDTHPALGPAVAWVLDAAEDDGTVPAETLERIKQLGREHRRHGFPPEIYPKFEASLIKGFEALALTSHQQQVATRALHMVCQAMAEAAHANDVAGIAPAYSAQVVAVEHPNRKTAIIRVESGAPIDYQTGQHFPVTSQLLPGTWRMLTPAHPADATGQLTFHVALAGDASSMLAKAKPGDWWTLGAPAGEPLELRTKAASQAGQAGTALISFGTGWAAARAALLDCLNSNDLPAGLSIYSVMPSPGEHYDTHFQANVQALAPRLSLHCIARSAQDPWLLGAQPQAEGFSVESTEDPMEAVLLHEGTAAKRKRFILVGPADRVEVSREALLNHGVPAEHIEETSWQRGHEWAASAADLDGWEDWDAWAAWKKSEWTKQ